MLEANPRASRTVPFVSKATGRRWSRPPAGQRWGCAVDLRRDVPPATSRVKAAVLPFQRFAGADPTLGPEMRSTGEVMGIGPDFPTAFAKAERAAGRPLPARGHASSSRSATATSRRRRCSPRCSSRSGSSWSRRPARRGRSQRIGIPVATVQKVTRGLAERGRPDPRGGVNLVINTPARPRRAGGRLRDPRGGHPPPHPLHHHAGRSLGRRAGDRAGPRHRADRAPGSARAAVADGEHAPPIDAGWTSHASRRSAPTRCCVLRNDGGRSAGRGSSSCSRRRPHRRRPTCRARSRRPGPTSASWPSCSTCAAPERGAGGGRRRRACSGRWATDFPPRPGPRSWSAVASAPPSCPGSCARCQGR